MTKKQIQEAKKTELARFTTKYGLADTAQILEHMAEKFPNASRPSLRGLLKRYRDSVKTPTNGVAGADEVPPLLGSLLGVQTGRSSSKKENVANTPKKKAAPVRKPRQKSAKPLAKQKTGRKRQEWPTITQKETKRRRNYVVGAVLENPKMSRKKVVAAVSQGFPGPSEEATTAMVQACRIVIAKHGVKDASKTKKLIIKRLAKYDLATCPQCKKTAKFEDEIQKEFGYRCDFDRRQSNCRGCRTTKLKKANG